ncbi:MULTISPECIES: hypothetical protein [unclassified Micromonospora]|uniref:hypothetical protein n=1 Tax=unclassified Micromonospora TaxID=2617518 RepID=UPI001C5FD850|nr:hypothetical protein [Micromonospora sp. RL09-050-HVF-A]MBW4704690.1 hypothetical protein [Micromonospora sp. RL09-050-HVF-A]
MRRFGSRITSFLVVAAVTCLGLVGAAAPAQAKGVIVFVAYFDNAAHSNLVGGSTFSECPGDPSYHWGAYTEFHEITSEPCP